MKKLLYAISLSAFLCISVLLIGCSENNDSQVSTEEQMSSENNSQKDYKDLYVGEYVSDDGTVKITKAKNVYDITFCFYDNIIISATGELNNGTLYFYGTEDENDIYGNIEEYGEDYPIRVEIYIGDRGLEFEFERK
ncbi:MAG: hypothetical protein IJW06_00950 [Clostridia bacterium]|nr:hypothetical protein [Clostridia bacterium]